MKSKIVENDLDKLNKFVKGLKPGYVVRVGILGNKNNRNDPKSKGKTNADIGLIHEFGTPKIPQRSFLRMPLFVKSDRILKEMADAQTLKDFANGDILKILGYLGKVCERVILDAFDTKGFGDWAANAASTIKRKKGSQPLIDHGFLRRSISSDVVKL